MITDDNNSGKRTNWNNNSINIQHLALRKKEKQRQTKRDGKEIQREKLRDGKERLRERQKNERKRERKRQKREPERK